MKDVTDKTQYDLIREDIDLIEKYYGTTNYNGLINDILIHIKSAEVLYKSLEERIEKAIEYIKNYKEEWNKYDEVQKDMDNLLEILEKKEV